MRGRVRRGSLFLPPKEGKRRAHYPTTAPLLFLQSGEAARVGIGRNWLMWAIPVVPNRLITVMAKIPGSRSFSAN
jgi:hypothetical protein